MCKKKELCRFHLGLSSLHRPKLCPKATWNSTGMVIANRDDVGKDPYGLFITHDDTVYIAARHLDRLVVWHEKNFNPVQTFTARVSYLSGAFVADSDQMLIARYIANLDYNIPPR